MSKKGMKKSIKEENKIKGSFKKNCKKILIILGLVGICFVITMFLGKTNKPKLKEIEVTEVISKLEDGSYYIFGVENDKTFEIEKQDNFSYEVLDSDNKKVEIKTTEADNKITLGPKEEYEDGKTYTLKITNGTFVEEELKEANVVVFNIKRPSKQVATLKEEIVKKTSEDIKVKEEKDNKITLETEEDYQKDEIVLVDESAAYKIEECKNNICTASIPTLEEVYSELDYYGAQELDLSSFVADEDFKENLKNNIDENLIGMIIPEVNAAAKTSLELKYDTKKNELVAVVNLSTDPEDKLFGNKFLNNHKFSTTFELGIKISAYQDITFHYQDIGLIITLRADMGVNVSHPAFLKFKETFEEEFNDDKLVDVKNYVKEAKKDNVDASNNIGKMSVPTGVFGLNVIFNAGYLFNFDLKTDLSANVKNTIITTIGFNTKKGLYGNIKNKPQATSEFLGEGEIRFGFQGEAGASLLNIVDIVGKMETGGYASGSLNIANTVTKETKTIIETKGEAGMFGTIKAEARTPFKTFSHTIFDDKFKIIDIEKKVDAKSIKEKDKPVSKEEDKPTIKPDKNKPSNSNSNSNKPTYRYTKDEVKQKIEKNYSKIIQDEFNGGFTGATTSINYFYVYKKLNLSNNTLNYSWKFGNYSDIPVNNFHYSCNYNYVTDTISCSNFSTAKASLTKECKESFSDSFLQQYPQYYGPNSVNECIDYYIAKDEQKVKSNIRSEMSEVLKKADLTWEDLKVLK